MTLLIESDQSPTKPTSNVWRWLKQLRGVWPAWGFGEFDEPFCPHCGSSLFDELVGRLSKPRSLPQHRRLFKIIKLAFDAWPEGHDEFQPDSEDHLRAWLICMAGPDFREVHRIPLNAFAPEGTDFTPEITAAFAAAAQATMKAVREDGNRFSFHRPHAKGGSIAVYVPLSMKFEKMPHLTFCKLNNAIEDVLRVVGLEPEQLLLERTLAA